MRVIFMGTPTFAVNSLNTLIEKNMDVVLVVTKKDTRQGRKMRLEMSSVKKRAIELGLEVYQPEDLKNAQVLEKFQSMRPDLIVVTAYGKILPPEILNLPKYGCINVHASLLPRYRGASPIHSCIINGDTLTGITTMFMDQGLDTGDIILQDEMEILPSDTSETLTDKLAKLSEKTLGNTINMLNLNMELPRVKQEEEKATYCSVLKKESGHIDYTKSADDIINLIRGTQPWPVAYSQYGDINFKIYAAKKMDTKSLKEPGYIVKSKGKELIISTATNDISILEVQFPSKKRMKIEDFLRGNTLEEGVQLQ